MILGTSKDKNSNVSNSKKESSMKARTCDPSVGMVEREGSLELTVCLVLSCR